MKIKIRDATPADNQILQTIQGQASFGEGGSISSVNSPDYCWRTGVYPESKVFVAYNEENEPMGTASCAVRAVDVAGKFTIVGYSWNYYTSPNHRRKGVAGVLIEHVEDYFRQHSTAISYVYIMDSNAPSKALFERAGYGLKKALLARYKLVYKNSATVTESSVRCLKSDDLELVAGLINATWQGHDLYSPYTADSLAEFIERVPGFSYENVLVLEKDGQIAACLGYWDRGKVVRTTVRSLDAKMRVASFVLDAARLFTPVPKVLKPGQVMEQYRLMLAGYREADDLRTLVNVVNNRALDAGVYAICGASEIGDPLTQALRNVFQNDVHLLLYVKTLDDGAALSDNPIYVDVIDI